MTNERMGVYMDMMVSKLKESIARLYNQKAEREQELENIQKEIWKNVGAVGALEQSIKQLEKIHEDMVREARMKSSKEWIDSQNWDELKKKKEEHDKGGKDE
jgi:DNA repair exonuclease SbcCD ATPase subunit